MQTPICNNLISHEQKILTLNAERHECSQNHHIVHMNEQMVFLCCLAEDFGFSSFRVHVVVSASAKGVRIC
jgi:hypothetical protein